MKKKKCPKCNSQRTEDSEGYFVCKKCGFKHEKTEREKKRNHGRNSNLQ